VSLDNNTQALPRPFFVIATQNPHEHHGTFPLPESQLDRFMMRINLGYPAVEFETAILRGDALEPRIATVAPVTNAGELMAEPDRIVEVEWAPSTDSVFLVAIQVEALDRHRLLSDVTRVLSDERVSILSASVTTSRDRVAVSRFTFELGDPKHLGHLLKAIRSVEGVYDVYRLTSGT